MADSFTFSGVTITGGVQMVIAPPAPPAGIVTNGLTINYDFSNPACYSGSGTTISDLSGNGHNSTYYQLDGGLFSDLTPVAPGANYSTAAGAPNFGGGMQTQESDLRMFGIKDGSVQLGTSWTVSVALTMPQEANTNISTIWTNAQYIGENGFQAAVMTLGSPPHPNITWGKARPDVLDGQVYVDNTNSVFGSVAIWDFVVNNAGTAGSPSSTTTLTLYKNGVQLSQATNQSGYNVADPAMPLMFGGIIYSPDQYIYGTPATYNNILIYANKALTSSEITQNYNARKSKYGLS